MSLIPEGTVNIHGHKVKKVVVFGVVAVVAVAGVIWYRQRNASSPAGPTSGTDAAGNVGVIDPATGYVEGSAEDLATLDTSSGTTDTTGSGGGSSGGSTTTQVTNGPPFTSNDAWAQYVTSYLVDNLNLDPGTVGEVLGKYLSGAQVTQSERDTVIGPATAYGRVPPVSGTNGYPPSVNLVGSPTGTGNTPSAPTLKLGAVTASSVTVSWVAVSGATSYAWTAGGKSGTTTGTTVTISGLTAGTTYTVTVDALNASGAGPTSTITAATSKAATPAPPKTTPAPVYETVKVVKASGSPLPWNSTISGIASHYGYGSDWESVWNDSKNASLRTKRKEPNLIEAGDTVYVKKK